MMQHHHNNDRHENLPGVCTILSIINKINLFNNKTTKLTIITIANNEIALHHLRFRPPPQYLKHPSERGHSSYNIKNPFRYGTTCTYYYLFE